MFLYFEIDLNKFKLCKDMKDMDFYIFNFSKEICPSIAVFFVLCSSTPVAI